MKASPSARDVVMIHGAFCGGWAFDHWRPPFEAAGYRVHTPDLRYHAAGHCPDPALGHVSLRDYADDLAALIAGFERPPILIGHSMGGLLAQMLAARGHAEALVLLAPSAPWGVLPTTPMELIGAQSLFLAGDFWRRPLKPERWVASQTALDGVPRRERERPLARLVPESGLATFEILHWPFDFSRASAVDARHVTCPILCFAGTADRINPPGTVRRIARRYRGRAQYRELDGASHWLIAEPGWESLIRQILFWLERLAITADTTVRD